MKTTKAAPQNHSSPPWRRVGAGVFLLSMGLLLYELCLTRVLSVLFYYHTAFLAISLALLGLGAGGLWVYLFGGWFRGRLRGVVTWGALSMGILPLLFPWLRLDVAQLERFFQLPFLRAFGLTVGVCLAPFLAGGVALAVLFQERRQEVPRLYAADLLGAAGGTLLLVPVMEWLGGPGALFACGVLVAASACLLARPASFWFPLLALVVLLGLTGAQRRWDLFPIHVDVETVADPGSDGRILFKKWNAFSRVIALRQQGWYRGMPRWRWERMRQKMVPEIEALIDINAFAPLIRFDGQLQKVSYLKEFVSNIGYHLLPRGRRVLILGPGGGKDVLGALLFAPQKVVGIELNPILVHDLVRDRFREFTGDLYRHPKVRIVVGDGRAVLRRMSGSFDIIVANSVITWAAHSAGAMNLAENTLYTVSACRLYLDRLRQGGILSVSLWDENRHSIPLRWLTTCHKASGVQDLSVWSKGVAVVASRWDTKSWFSTILISNQPWSPAQRVQLRQVSARLGFELLYLPGEGSKNAKEFQAFFDHPQRFQERFRYNIQPVTDDRPFFLYTLRWREALRFWEPERRSENLAYFSLVVSLLLVFVLVVLAIWVPLWWDRRRQKRLLALASQEGVMEESAIDKRVSEGRALRGGALLYFAALGAGFMLVEIPLIQRFTLFLGHPTYALTVVLFGLLLWSGLGSRLAARWVERGVALARLRWGLVLLVALLVGGWWLLQGVLPWIAGAATFWRIAFTLLALAPVGLLMGTALPVGLYSAGQQHPAAIPWAWGVNGTTGVLASVGAIFVAVQFGFTVALALGACCYLLAWLSLSSLQRSPPPG